MPRCCLALVSLLSLLATTGCAGSRDAVSTQPVTPEGTDAKIWTPALVSGSKPGLLRDIAVLNPNDAWAVGQTTDQLPKAQAAHWDGTGWAQVPVPSLGEGRHDLLGVAAPAPNDVWAVGMYEGSPNASRAMLMHWDGTSWKLVPGPDLASPSSLQAVAAVNSDDVWAVGSEGEKPLIIHWDGRSWSVVPTPVFDEPSYLNGIAAISARDIWAVGATGKETLTLHWDGTAWQRVASPSLDTNSPVTPYSGIWSSAMWSSLEAITAIAPDDVWAVGVASDRWPGSRLSLEITLAMHWDGETWTMSEAPGSRGLFGVTAQATDRVWAVGRDLWNLVVMRWDGQTWSINPCPAKGLTGAWHVGTLESVAVLSETDLMAVGMIEKVSNQSDFQTIGYILRPAIGACPTATSVPTVTPWPTLPPATLTAYGAKHPSPKEPTRRPIIPPAIQTSVPAPVRTDVAPVPTR
jgi:hypothetical protein